MTLRDLLLSAASRLKQARISEPRLEAETLLSRLLRRDPAWLLAHAEASATPAQAKTYAKLVAARTRRVPFAYLAGEKWFYGRPFIVTKGVLIPRPETELLIEAVLAAQTRRRGRAEPLVTILDVGAGSGAIGLTLASELPKSRAVLYDVSRRALAVTKKNAERLHLGRRASFARLDILRHRLPEPKDRAILVANLPYLPLAAWKSAEPEVRLHEPKLALVSGKDGLDHYRALFKNLVQWKRKPKLVALEAEPGQFEELSRLAQEAMPDGRIEILKDLHGDERVLLVSSPRSVSDIGDPVR